jgi:hypothetical protein
MDGAFTVEILGGTAPYQVSLDNPSGTYTHELGQTEFDFTNLGWYSYCILYRCSRM